MNALRYIHAVIEAAGDDHVRIVQWLVPEGSRVDAATPVALAESTKAAFEIPAEAEGFLFHLAAPGDRIRVGEPIAVLAPENVRPALAAAPAAAAVDSSPAGDQVFTRKALELMERHQIPASAFAGSSLIRGEDVEAYLQSQTKVPASRPRMFGAETLEPGGSWESDPPAADVAAVQQFLTAMRRRLKGRFNRHVPLGTLLHDRWDLAREYGFGEGTSVYDECLILGDVTVGKHCWVGPFTVLDGNFAAIRIGDHTSIGSGSHIYSHHAIDNIITRGETPTYTADTTIGDACFISPMSIVGPGSNIGSQSFVASGSFVQGIFPPRSYIAGTPARRIGRVEIRQGRVVLIKEDAGTTESSTAGDCRRSDAPKSS